MPRTGDAKSQLYSLFTVTLILIGLLICSSGRALAVDACPALNFNVAPSYPAGLEPSFVASGDFNRDGIYDLAVANGWQDTGITIMLGDGHGGFVTTGEMWIGASSPPGFIAVGDFNRDGKADLAATPVGYGDVSVLLGDGQGGFSQATTFAAGLKPNSLIINDFNNDGALDLAAANVESNSISILLGNNTGGFAAPKNVSLFHVPGAMDVGDFNNDNKTDIIAVMPAFASEVTTILFGDGAGNFTAQPTFAGGTKHVKVADFNQDGKADIVSVQANGVRMVVRLGNGVGGFTSSKVLYGLTPSDIALGDYNRDGKTDIAVSSTGFNHVSILHGDGLGNFSRTDFAAGLQPVGILTSDFNRDGKSDLAVINAKSNDVSILIGNGQGGFGAASNYAGGQTTESLGIRDSNSIASADFNGDGRADLAVTNFRSLNVVILLNDGSGRFTVTSNYPLGTLPKSVASADFNGDGKADLAVAHSFAGGTSITTLLGTGDGKFNYAGFFWSMDGGDASYVTTGDLNGDGRADISFLNTNFKVRVALSTGSGFNLLSTNFAAGGSPVGISLGDLNGDGKLDFVVTNSNGVPRGDADGLLIAFGDGSGGITGTRTQLAGDNPHEAVMRDFNADGKLDLAVTNSFTFPQAGVSLLLGDGAGGFAPPKNFEFGGSPRGVAVGDFDADGKLDLAATSIEVNKVGILRGDGAGNFATAVGYATGTEPLFVAVGDFNGDGKSDVATVNFTASNVTVLLTVACGTVPPSSTIQLGQSSRTVGEADGQVAVQVNRTDATAAASVDYATFDTLSSQNTCQDAFGIASARCDYAATIGTLQFAAGETSKTIFIPIVEDNIIEGIESFAITLSNSSGASLGSIRTATIAITDNDAPPSPPYLILDESGMELNQAAAMDSMLFLKDPFPVVNSANMLNRGTDKNTRVIIFVNNLQLAQGETSSSVIINLVGSNSQSYDLPVEDMRLVPGFNFAQVIFRLPDNLAPGTCTIKVKLHGLFSNPGTIRIKS